MAHLDGVRVKEIQVDQFISTILHFQCRIKSSIQYTVQYNTIELQGKSDKRELEIANEIKRDQIEDRHLKKFRARQHTSGRGGKGQWECQSGFSSWEDNYEPSSWILLTHGK